MRPARTCASRLFPKTHKEFIATFGAESKDTIFQTTFNTLDVAWFPRTTMAEPPGEGILNARPPSLGTDAPASLVSKSHDSTPAIAVGGPFDDTRTEDRTPMPEENGSNAFDTPRKADPNSALLEGQVNQLQAKLADMEKKILNRRRWSE